MDKMKKVITILIIMSIVAVCLMIFLPESYTWVLFPFAIPLVLGPVSLAVKRDKIKPKIWLIIYGIAVVVYLILMSVAIHFWGPPA